MAWDNPQNVVTRLVNLGEPWKKYLLSPGWKDCGERDLTMLTRELLVPGIGLVQVAATITETYVLMCNGRCITGSRTNPDCDPLFCKLLCWKQNIQDPRECNLEEWCLYSLDPEHDPLWDPKMTVRRHRNLLPYCMRPFLIWMNYISHNPLTQQCIMMKTLNMLWRAQADDPSDVASLHPRVKVFKASHFDIFGSASGNREERVSWAKENSHRGEYSLLPSSDDEEEEMSEREELLCHINQCQQKLFYPGGTTDVLGIESNIWLTKFVNIKFPKGTKVILPDGRKFIACDPELKPLLQELKFLDRATSESSDSE
nr:bel2 protein [Feline foamy virus]